MWAFTEACSAIPWTSVLSLPPPTPGWLTVLSVHWGQLDLTPLGLQALGCCFPPGLFQNAPVPGDQTQNAAKSEGPVKDKACVHHLLRYCTDALSGTPH